MDFTTTYRKLVMPQDLNPANRLFGGRMMEWADEAAALYVMCQLGTKNVVTVKVSEINFSRPVEQGDFLEFSAAVKKWGTSSVTIELAVFRRNLENQVLRVFAHEVLRCEFVFVHIDPQTGKATPHGK